MDESKPMRELTRIRQEQGLSQQRLADASGVNKATINQIERGRRSPNVDTLERLASALNAEIADFFPKAEAQLPLDFQENGSATGPYDDLGYPTVADMVVGKMFEQANQDRQAFHRAVESGMAQGYFLRHENDVMARLLRLPKAEVAEACIDLAREYVSLAHQAAMSEQDLSTAEAAFGPHEYATAVDQIMQEAADQGLTASFGTYEKNSSGIPQIRISSGGKVRSTKTSRENTRKKRAKKQ